jgi:uncharacterized membrane protein YedE/YeeE
MDWLSMVRWSPYAVGIGMGIVSWLALFLSDRTIGCSTPFAQLSGMVERWFRGDRVKDKPYFLKYPPVVDWGFMLLVGVVIGSFASSVFSGRFQPEWVPQRWATAFGTAPVPRLIVAFIGGVLMGVGSRWAGGCTSGHGISGTLQLAISSWVAVIGFFAGGIAAAMLIFRVLS